MRLTTAGISARPVQPFSPPPCAFRRLDRAVVAVFADALNVIEVPEQRGVAVVPDLVVGNELRGLVVDSTATFPLTSEFIAHEYI